MKLTSDQIEALRQLGDWAEQLAYRVYTGEIVTVEREIKRWEPDWRLLHGPASEVKECRATMRLLAYREEFAPAYVVPEAGVWAHRPCLSDDGEWLRSATLHRDPTTVYMPPEVVKDLCRKLNSGEVVL